MVAISHQPDIFAHTIMFPRYRRIIITAAARHEWSPTNS
jgi:hypothetical protein